MPDLNGMSAKDVLDIFVKLDVDLEIEGKGVVVKQYPKAGTSLENIEVR